MKRTDLLVGFLTVAFGAFVSYRTVSENLLFFDGQPRSGFLPQLLAALFVILGGSLIASRVTAPADKFGPPPEFTVESLRAPGWMFAALFFSILLINVIGFVLAMATLCIVMTVKIEKASPLGMVLVSTLIPFGLWAMFTLGLGIRLPTGPFGF